MPTPHQGALAQRPRATYTQKPLMPYQSCGDTRTPSFLWIGEAYAIDQKSVGKKEEHFELYDNMIIPHDHGKQRTRALL